ncbi:hypothetical protein DL98DRAFT_538475 [Cadophora sp. DSE1049]|nr:hypothetical protein DL98DRAFT_538475 [Cadophora sp. DSE1049]
MKERKRMYMRIYVSDRWAEFEKLYPPNDELDEEQRCSNAGNGSGDEDDDESEGYKTALEEREVESNYYCKDENSWRSTISFYPSYLISSDEPVLVKNVNNFVEAAKGFHKGRPRYCAFNFNLKNMPLVMERITAFDASTDPSSKLCPELREDRIRMHIKNKISQALRRHKDDDPRRDY